MLWAPLTNCVSWKGLSYLLIGVFVTQIMWSALISNSPSSTGHLSQSTLDSNTRATPSAGVVSQVLTTEECTDAYPRLYSSIDRAVAFWKSRHHIISEQDVNITWRRDAALRVLIHDNKPWILETRGVHINDGYRQRAMSVLSMLEKALWSASAVGEMLPTIETSIVVDDMSLLDGDPAMDTRSTWTFASNLHDANHKRHWLVPNFSMYSAPATGSFEDMCQLARQRDAPFIDKIPKVVWRGVKWANEALRGALLDATDGREWADVAAVNWEKKENLMSMDENCAYAFTIHTEGRSYSGRLPFLLKCNSLPLIHPMDWATHFDHLLVAKGSKQNFVPVKRDFSDLERAAKYYLDHPQKAQRIIQNMVDTVRDKYTMPTATSCYLRQLITAYGSVSFTPNVTRPPTGDGVLRRKGVSFEEFIHMSQDYAGDDIETFSDVI